MIKYKTLEGDTYDMISLDMYGVQFLGTKIAQANPDHAGVIVFGAGVVLNIPFMDSNEKKENRMIAPWER